MKKSDKIIVVKGYDWETDYEYIRCYHFNKKSIQELIKDVTYEVEHSFECELCRDEDAYRNSDRHHKMYPSRELSVETLMDAYNIYISDDDCRHIDIWIDYLKGPGNCTRAMEI